MEKSSIIENSNTPYSTHRIAMYEMLNSKHFDLLKATPRNTYFVNDNETEQPTVSIWRYEVHNIIEYLRNNVVSNQLCKETIKILYNALYIIDDSHDIITFVKGRIRK